MRTALALLLLGAALAGCTGSAPGSGTGSATPPSASPVGVDVVGAAIAPGPLETVEASYRLADLRIPGLRAPVEVEGHVVGPVGADGPLPLAVLLHGYTASCWNSADGSSTTQWPCGDGYQPIPNWRGFDYLQRHLASQGVLTVSLSANGVNVMATDMGDDAGSAARSALVRRHLDAWASGEVPGVTLWSDVDVDNVLLVGHSRGGEGVDRASRERPRDAAWTIRGEVLVAPTAFDPGARGSVPLVAMTGYCDGDVGPGAAQRYVDRAADPALLRSAVIVEGANHNFFNAEWVPGDSAVPGAFDDAYLEGGEVDPLCAPDSPTRLTASEQQDVAVRILGLASAAFLRGEQAAADVLDGRVAVPTAVGTRVRVAATGRGRATLTYGDGFTGTGEGAVAVEPCDGISETEDPGDCGAFTGEGASVHWPAAYRDPVVRQYLEVTWQRAEGAARLDLASPMDLSAAAGIAARIALDPDGSPARFDLAIQDAAGGTASLPGATIEAFPQGPLLPSRRWGQQVNARLEAVTDVDLTRVVTVSLVPRSPRGRAWIIDLSTLPESPTGP
jgi:dienelactone hydrolase